MIICCGEALIDFLPRPLAEGGEGFQPVSGGAIFNTALALGRLGAQVGLLAGVSEDMFGQKILADLQKSGVSTEYLCRMSKPSTLAFVQLVDGQAQYTFMDENSAMRGLNEAMLPTLPDPLEALHFGGISLISEPCGSAYEALMRRESERCVISFDPNIRTGFITDHDSHRARIARMLALSDIVKVSDEDLAWIAPNTPTETAIRAILQQGASIVLLTKGAEGIVAYSHDFDVHVQAQKVAVVDTIGAGDTFNAGFLYGLKRQDCLERSLRWLSAETFHDAIEFANQVAAVTVSRAGANSPWLHELKK